MANRATASVRQHTLPSLVAIAVSAALLAVNASALNATSRQRVGRVRAYMPRWASSLPTRGLEKGPGVALDAAKFYSQRAEDRLVYDQYFYNMYHGFYLEMGALDGVFFSNTKFLSDSLLWRGLLIEPSPQSYRALIANRPNDICLRAAICSQYRMVEYLTHRGGAVHGILDFMSPEFLAKWHPDIPQARRDGHVIPMPCVPLQDILDHYSITHVDFWSLDVEGAELEILKTVDFQRVHFSVITIELAGTDRARDDTIKSLLLSNNFIFDQQNTSSTGWFLHRDFKPFSRSTNAALKSVKRN